MYTKAFLLHLIKAWERTSKKWIGSTDYEIWKVKLDKSKRSSNSPVQFSCSVMSNSLQPHGLQHARPPCPSPTPRVYSNSCPLSRWCHPTVLSSVNPFKAWLQSFPGSESFQMSQFFASGGQSIGVSNSPVVFKHDFSLETYLELWR